MTDSTLKQITFDEWAIDVTFAKQNGDIAFVPICGDDVVRELTMIRDRAALGVARHNEGISSLWLESRAKGTRACRLHWGSKGTQDTPVRDFKGTGDGCSTHATTVHEVDEVAIKLVGGHAGQFG